MRWGIESGSIDPSLPYSQPILAASQYANFPVALLYAVAWRESIHGETCGLWPSACYVTSDDGGHGLFQLTSSWPANWQTPEANARWACDMFLLPAVEYWHNKGFEGDALAKLVVASFNAGIGGAERGHNEGDADKYTTDGYAAAVLGFYKHIVATGRPQ